MWGGSSPSLLKKKNRNPLILSTVGMIGHPVVAPFSSPLPHCRVEFLLVQPLYCPVRSGDKSRPIAVRIFGVGQDGPGGRIADVPHRDVEPLLERRDRIAVERILDVL